MDPGNWATDIAGGSRFGYRLLPVAALPAVDFPTIQITATLPGAGPGGVPGINFEIRCATR